MRGLLLTVIASLSAIEATAQSRPNVTGIIRDSRSERPLVGTLVNLRTPATDRSTRTDEAGAFAFTNVPDGTYTLSVRLIGYVPETRTIDVAGANDPLAIDLVQVATLDTVRIRAVRQGLFGVVGRSRDLQPLPQATVHVLGESGRQIKVDSNGRFFLPLKSSGSYFVRATAPSYRGQSISVTIPRDGAVDVVLLLDTATSSSPVLEHAFADFRERMVRRRRGAALITRSELLRNGDADLLTAIMRAPSFTNATLRFERTACVFSDGRPLPGVPVQTFNASDVEAVEVYGVRQDASGTLSARWPRLAACGETGMPQSIRRGQDVVAWVAIWLKQ